MAALRLMGSFGFGFPRLFHMLALLHDRMCTTKYNPGNSC
jgi:hypothetical protein